MFEKIKNCYLLLFIVLLAIIVGCDRADNLSTEQEQTNLADELYVESMTENIHYRDNIKEDIHLKFYNVPDGFELQSSDISLSEGFENMKVVEFSKELQDEYKLVIAGNTNQTTESGVIKIKNNIDDTVLSTNVYFLEEPYLSEINSVYAHNNAPQVIELGVVYGSFSDKINKDDIILKDAFDNCKILDVEYKDDRHIAVTLKNDIDLTKKVGTITIKANGFVDEHGYNEDLSIGVAIVSPNVNVYPKMLIHENNLDHEYKFKITFPHNSYKNKITKEDISFSEVFNKLKLTRFQYLDEKTIAIETRGVISDIGKGVIGFNDELISVKIDVVEDRYILGTAKVDTPLKNMEAHFTNLDGKKVDAFDKLHIDNEGNIIAHVNSHKEIPSDFRIVVKGDILVNNQSQKVELMANYHYFCPTSDNFNINLLTTMVCMVMDKYEISYEEAYQKVIDFLQIDNQFFDITSDKIHVNDFDAKVFQRDAGENTINEYLTKQINDMTEGKSNSFKSEVGNQDITNAKSNKVKFQKLSNTSSSVNVTTLKYNENNQSNLITLSTTSEVMTLLEPKIKEGLTSVGGAVGKKVGDMTFNWVLQSIGVDTRTDEEKILDELKKVERMLSDIQKAIVNVESELSKEIDMATFQTRSSTLTNDISKIENAYDTYQRICEKTTVPNLRKALKNQLMSDIENYNIPLILEHINQELTSQNAGKIPLLQNYWNYLVKKYVFQHQGTPAMTHVYNDYAGIQTKALMLYTEYCHAKAEDITNPNDLYMNNAKNEHDKLMTNLQDQAKFVKSDKGSAYVRYYNDTFDSEFHFLIVNKNGSKWSLMKQAINRHFGYQYGGYIPYKDEDNDFFMGIPPLVTKSSERNSTSTHNSLRLFLEGAKSSTKIGAFLKENNIYPSKASNSTIWLYVGHDDSKDKTYGLKTSRECSDVHVDYISAHDGHTHSLADLYRH